MDRFELLRTELTRRCPGLELREEEPMARHTSFHIGGPARLMALPRTEEEARETLQAAWALEIPPFSWGTAPICWWRTGDMRALWSSRPGRWRKYGPSPRNGRGEGAAGGGRGRAAVPALQGRAGSGPHRPGVRPGHPGSVGGGVTMNAGAYGGETAQVLLQVTALERDGTQRLLSGADCGLSYRHSRFSEGDLLICRAVFALPEGNREEIAGRMADFAQRRREKQPLEYPSAGSTFKRPQGHFAAALIDQCGLKGRAVGGAQVSEKHAGFLINRGRHLRRCPGAGGPGAAGGAAPDRRGAGAGDPGAGVRWTDIRERSWTRR